MDLKSRQEIKALARGAFRDQRKTGIILFVWVLLVSLVMSVSYGLGYMGVQPEMYPVFPITIPYSVGMAGMLFYLAMLFFYVPFFINIEGAYTKIYSKDKVSAREPFSKMKVNYVRKLGGFLWMCIWYCLWSLLFVIPGIIKLIAYSMTPFILAVHPNVTARKAMKLSMRMTKGHKGKLFVMVLSFIGWQLLGVLTLGVLSIVFVGPYFYTTCAGYFIELRDKAISDGLIDPAELGMAAPEEISA